MCFIPTHNNILFILFIKLIIYYKVKQIITIIINNEYNSL